jgi:hypothetical protein
VSLADAGVDRSIVERVEALERDPLRAGKVRRRNHPVAFLQDDELFVGTFERDPVAGVRIQAGDRKHSAANLEYQVVSPLDVLGRTRQREAQFSEAFDVHKRNRPSNIH